MAGAYGANLLGQLLSPGYQQQMGGGGGGMPLTGAQAQGLTPQQLAMLGAMQSRKHEGLAPEHEKRMAGKMASPGAASTPSFGYPPKAGIASSPSFEGMGGYPYA